MRVFSAKIEKGHLIADGGEVVDCPIIGQGGDSTGVLVISAGELAYIPNTTPDLSDCIDDTIKGLQGAADALNAVQGGAADPITYGAFQSAISSGVASIAAAVEALGQLKGRLK